MGLARVARLIALPAIIVGARQLLGPLNHGADGIFTAAGAVMVELSLEALVAAHYLELGVAAQGIHEEHTRDAAMRAHLVNEDLAKAVGKTVARIARTTFAKDAVRSPWRPIIDEMEDAWVVVARRSELGPLDDSELGGSLPLPSDREPFPPMDNHGLWRSLLKEVIDTAQPQGAESPTEHELEMLVSACDRDFRSEFYNTLKHDFGTGGRAYAGVMLRAVGELTFGVRVLTKTTERERAQLDRITQLLHDVCDELIKHKVDQGHSDYQGFKPLLTSIKADTEQIRRNTIALAATADKTLGIVKSTAVFLGGPELTKQITIAVTSAHPTKKQSRLVLTLLLMLCAGLVLSSVLLPRLPSQPTARATAVLDPVLERIIARRASHSSSGDRHGSRPLPTEVLGQLDANKGQGAPIQQALRLLAMAESSQSQSMLAEVDKRIAVLETRNAGGAPRSSTHECGYFVLKGYRALANEQTESAVKFLRQANAMTDSEPAITLLLCFALNESPANGRSMNAKEVVKVATKALTAKHLEKGMRLRLQCKLVEGLYLQGEILAASEAARALGSPISIAKTFSSDVASPVLAVLGQQLLFENQTEEASEALELARQTAFKYLPVNHPDYVAIRIAQAHSYAMLGNVKEAIAAVADFEALLKEGTREGRQAAPFAFSAAAAVKALEAQSLGSPEHPAGDPELLRNAAGWQEAACTMLEAQYGVHDPRTIDAIAELGAMYWAGESFGKALSAMNKVLEIVRSEPNARHPRYVQAMMVYSVMLVVHVGEFPEDGSHSATGTDIQVALEASALAVEIARANRAALLSSTETSAKARTVAMELLGNAISQLTECRLLAGMREESLRSATELLALRAELSEQDSWKIASSEAMLGRAKLLNGDVDGAMVLLRLAYEKAGENLAMPIRAQWALRQAMCKACGLRGDTEGVREWCGRAQNYRNNHKRPGGT